MNKWFKELDKTTQMIVVVAVIVVIFMVLRSGKNYIQKLGEFGDNLGEKAALGVKGVKASFSKSEYNTFANQLENAMAGSGTDENLIFKIFNKMENDLDILNLETAFGLRSSWGSNYDLSEWLRGDLGTTDMNKLNQILSGKGITKQF